MATVSDSSFDGFNSPQPPLRSLSSGNPSSSSPSSPWSQVVRSSSDSEAIASAIPFSSPQELDHDKAGCSSSEVTTVNCDGSGNAGGRTKKQAWNKPSNGVVEVGNVMGSSWPALSESARVSPKSSSDSLKALDEGSVSASPQGPVTPSSPQKSNSINTNPNLTPTHAFPARQKPNKRGGGPNNNGGFQSPPSLETAQNASDRVANEGVDLSPRAIAQKNSNWEFGSRGSFVLQQPPHAGNDQQRNSVRRGNGGGPHPRGGGDGSYQNSYGSRREQDRRNYEWNPHQNFSGRDIHVRQHRAGPRGFVRQQPLSPPPFLTPLPVRAYAAPVGFSDAHSPIYYVPTPSPESFGMVPYVGPATPHGMFIPAPDPQLRSMLIKQIDYYFSSENLCKDIFLRQNMDEQGWVPISLIATFNRVKQLTIYVPFIMEAVRSSTVVEVQGDKIRKRNDWMNWLLPPPNQFSPGLQSPNYDALATQIQNIGLEGTVNHNTWAQVDSHAEGVLTRSSSWQANRQLPATMLTVITNGEEMAQTSIHMGSERPIAVRRLEE